MAFMWRGVSSLAEKFQSIRHLKLLLALPVFVCLAVGSYKIGQTTGSLKQGDEKDAAVLTRHRRNAPVFSNQSTQQPAVAAGGATYVRWGRTECPFGSDAVYKGVAGGSFFDVHGGGSNYLCLPLDPIWGNFKEDAEKASKIYGAEYQSPTAFDLKNAGGRSLHDHNVPCVVCRSRRFISVVMIPARNRCYDDWNVEYSGYLMSGSSVHKARTEFVCVDGSPETDPAGHRDENGVLFYNVEGVCGSLPCPPYVQRREFTCVVCSK